jgi:hypothetical protein
MRVATEDFVFTPGKPHFQPLHITFFEQFQSEYESLRNCLSSQETRLKFKAMERAVEVVFE